MGLLKGILKLILVTGVLIGITMLLFGEAVTPTSLIVMFLKITTGGG